MSEQPCPDERGFDELLRGQLTVGQTAEIERHVESCPRCLAELERITTPAQPWIDDFRRFASTASETPINFQKALDRIGELSREARRDATSPVTQRIIETNRIADYDLLSELRRGGMGRVFRVRSRSTSEVFALKILTPERLPRTESVERFQREIRLLRELRHQQVVRAIDSGLWRGVPFVVMEFLDGIDLDELIRQRGPLAVPDAAELTRQIALGLRYVHELKLVHRDVKPSNVMLTADRVCLLDLGLARVAETDWDLTGPTMTGEALGTLRYAAPEQLSRAHAVDSRADLYGLGATLLWLLTGRPPFADADPREVWQRKLSEPIASDPSLDQLVMRVDSDVLALLRRLLARSPEDRPNSVDAVLHELERFSAGHQVGELARAAISTRTPVRDETTARPISVVMTVLENEPRGMNTVVRAAAVIGFLLVAAFLSFAAFRRGDVVDASHLAPKRNPSATSSTTTQTATQKSMPPTKRGWQGWSVNAPPPAIAPFSADQAAQHQADWANNLSVPVEFTNSIGLTLQFIPPGEFEMGATAEDVELMRQYKEAAAGRSDECLKSELPQHRVVLTQPFYLGRFEVTQSQFESVMKRNPALFAKSGTEPELAAKAAGLDTSQHPVESVSRSDAAEFCTKLSEKEKLQPNYFRAGDEITQLKGTGYRLPTEAEWEFACRAGTVTPYWSGSHEADAQRVGWVDANSDGRTHAVGELSSNPFGLHDMHGNVFEWIHDQWSAEDFSRFLKVSTINPVFNGSDNRLYGTRGGSWRTSRPFCRSSLRVGFDFTMNVDNTGFRVALPIDAVRQALRAKPKESVELGSERK